VIEGTVDLADGRRLAYAQGGETDAPAVLYCHGFPTNRRELALLQPALERSAVRARVLAFNRPGYGASTFQAARSFLAWPRDVAEAADRLGIASFAVLGVSGGCPYALACGYALGDRVTRIGIVAGVAPTEATGMSRATVLAQPSAIGLLRRIQFGMAALALRHGREDRFLERSIASMGAADRAAMTHPETREWMAETLQESFQQGGRPIAHEAGLYRRPWGFELSEITQPTLIWHGDADETVPATAGRWLADRLPGADYRLLAGHGHFTWMPSDEGAAIVGATASSELSRTSSSVGG